MNSYWRKKFAWSNSRHNAWHECKKQFYFNYIKCWDGLGPDKGRDLIWDLKKLQKIPFLKGHLIHEAIKLQISNHSAGRGASAELATKFFSSRFDNSLKLGGSVIAEFANGFPPGSDEIRKIREDGISQLENFFSVIWPNYQQVKLLGHEGEMKFSVEEIPVSGRYDLFSESNGNYVITDWKTGSEGFDDISESTQMGVYILWASAEKKIPLDRIKAEIVYLRTGNMEVTGRTEHQIDELKEFIKHDSGEMLAIKSETDFPASPSRKRCIGCNFLTICNEGKEELGARSRTKELKATNRQQLDREP